MFLFLIVYSTIVLYFAYLDTVIFIKKNFVTVEIVAPNIESLSHYIVKMVLIDFVIGCFIYFFLLIPLFFILLAVEFWKLLRILFRRGPEDLFDHVFNIYSLKNFRKTQWMRGEDGLSVIDYKIQWSPEVYAKR